MKEKISYKKAYEELQQLMLAIESDEINDLEEMMKKAKRANELIVFCREKLRSAETELNNPAKTDEPSIAD